MNKNWPPVSEDQMEELSKPENHGLDPASKFEFSCNLTGRCCFGTPVLISPFDIWNLATNDELMTRMDAESTVDLFDANNGCFDLYIGENSRLPTASIRQQKLGDDAEMCPFVMPVYNIKGKHVSSFDGTDRPMFLCGIHDAQPTICRSYPLGRAVLVNLDGHMGQGETKIINHAPGCHECWVEGDKEKGYQKMVSTPNPLNKLFSGTVQEFLDSSETTLGWDMTTKWWSITDKILHKDELPNHMRFLIGVMAYNFDSGWAMQKCGKETIWKNRPATFEDHLARVDAFVDVMLGRELNKLPDVLARFGVDIEFILKGANHAV